MIREEDLKEAIAECEGSRSPNASTCLKLAAYYALLDRKFGSNQTQSNPSPQYSFAAEPDIKFGDSEFSQLVEDKGISKCFPVIDEMMGALEMLIPKLYNATMRKLEEL